MNVPDLNGSYNMGSIGFPSYNPFATPSGSTNPYDGLMPEGSNMFDPTGTFSGNPGYALAKLLGIKHGRTKSSLAEMAGGYRGIGQGLAAFMGGNR